MFGLRETREFLLMAYQDGDIDDSEFCMLYDMNQSQNLDFPYWSYGPFHLDEMDDSECWCEFRFYKNDIYRPKEVLQIPDVLRTYNRLWEVRKFYVFFSNVSATHVGIQAWFLALVDQYYYQYSNESYILTLLVPSGEFQPAIPTTSWIRNLLSSYPYQRSTTRQLFWICRWDCPTRLSTG